MNVSISYTDVVYVAPPYVRVCEERVLKRWFQILQEKGWRMKGPFLYP